MLKNTGLATFCCFLSRWIIKRSILLSSTLTTYAISFPGLFAPYPNGNNMFHYQFSADSDSGMTKLKVTFQRVISLSATYSGIYVINIFSTTRTQLQKAVCDSRTERSAFLSGTTVFPEASMQKATGFSHLRFRGKTDLSFTSTADAQILSA